MAEQKITPLSTFLKEKMLFGHRQAKWLSEAVHAMQKWVFLHSLCPGEVIHGYVMPEYRADCSIPVMLYLSCAKWQPNFLWSYLYMRGEHDLCLNTHSMWIWYCSWYLYLTWTVERDKEQDFIEFVVFFMAFISISFWNMCFLRVFFLVSLFIFPKSLRNSISQHILSIFTFQWTLHKQPAQTMQLWNSVPPSGQRKACWLFLNCYLDENDMNWVRLTFGIHLKVNLTSTFICEIH